MLGGVKEKISHTVLLKNNCGLRNLFEINYLPHDKKHLGGGGGIDQVTELILRQPTFFQLVFEHKLEILYEEYKIEINK